jgi:hypothetical protein
MNAIDAVDQKLDTLAGARFADAPDALAALAEATGAINAALEESEPGAVAGLQRQDELGVKIYSYWSLPGGDTRERLRRWIEKLRGIVKSIAEQFAALSYSVSVSIPGGVSVGVSWSTD